MSSETVAALKRCRGCLRFGVKLFNIHDIKLVMCYTRLVGCTLQDELSQVLCSMCAVQLQKCSAFQRRCHKAYNLMVASDFHKQNLEEVDIGSYIGPLSYSKSATLTYQYPDTSEDIIKDIELKEEKEEGTEELTEELVEGVDVEYLTEELVEHDSVFVDANREIKIEDSDVYQENETVIVNDKEDKPVNVQKKKLSKKTQIKIKNEQDIIQYAESLDFDVEFLTEEQQYAELEEKKANKAENAIHCELCAKKFNSEKTLKLHCVRDHDENKRFVCNICKWRGPYANKLSVHMRIHREVYKCRQCPLRTRRHDTLASHYSSHKGQTHECKYCQKQFHKSTTYLSHVRLAHASELPWCELCGESFIGRGMKFHKTRVHKDIVLKYSCEHCGCMFVSEDALKKHVSEKCDSAPCVLCGDGFPNSQMLKYHLILWHNSGVPLVDCGGCSVKFHNAAAYRRHLPSCGVAAGDAAPQHVGLRHAGRDHFECCECNKKFSNAFYYRDHLSRVHLGRECSDRRPRARRTAAPSVPSQRTWRPAGDLDVLPAGEQTKERKQTARVICETCGRGFNGIARLEFHKLTHSETRQYQCEHCSKAFRDPVALEMHTRVHTGERPYVCEHCPKAFKSLPARARHHLVHSGVRRHVCQLCSKTFQTSSSVKAHIRGVHMKIPAPPRQRRRKKEACTQ